MTVATVEPRDATLGVDHPAASRPEGVAGAGDFDIDDGVGDAILPLDPRVLGTEPNDNRGAGQEHRVRRPIPEHDRSVGGMGVLLHSCPPLRMNDNDYHSMHEEAMSRNCQVTGATPSFGNSVSHSHRRTRRRWNVNVQNKRYWVPSLSRHVTLRVSARGIHTIDQRGIDAVVADLLARGRWRPRAGTTSRRPQPL